ncbi:MIT domain-containing protein 1-like isoform X2 [Athalia rosae]|uniref:MIT domain-containing protein 1-like isoform X2 n=1 Tax=Athalia rosae TaxID=37344 RepID=UPI00203321D3|nr:MIT domain-containing protein 1-like isoform X2 [Athalia rosae]
MESAAVSILLRAVEMDSKQRYTMALVLYQEGLQILMDLIKETGDPGKKKHFKVKAEEYMNRAETIKIIIQEQKAAGAYREQTRIEAGSIGYGYATVFGRFLDASVTHVHIEDPYIRLFHQCQNLLRLCELCVQKCHSLKKVTLVTTQESDERKGQIANLKELKLSLGMRQISFEFEFSSTLHDRQVRLMRQFFLCQTHGMSQLQIINSLQNMAHGLHSYDKSLQSSNYLGIFL